MKTQPPRVRRQKRPASKSEHGPGALTFATASLIGVLVLVITVQLLRSVLPKVMDFFDRGNRIDLAYLPPDAELLIVLHPARVWNSALFEACRTHPEYSPRLSTLWKLTGLRPEQVNLLTVGAKGIARPPSAAHETNLDEFVAVFRCRREVPDPAAVKGLARVEHASIDGTDYWKISPASAADGTALAAWRADATTLVIGQEQLVRDAIESSGRTERRADLDFINPNQDLLAVFAPDTPRGLEEFGLGALIPDLRESSIDSLSRHLRAVSFGVTFDRDLRVEAIGVCRDGKGAVLESGIQTSLAEAGESLSASLSSADENWRRLYHLAGQTVDSADTTRSGDTVYLSAQVPRTIESIAKHRSIGRAHRWFYRPLDWMFGKFPSPSFLAEFHDKDYPPTEALPDESPDEPQTATSAHAETRSDIEQIPQGDPVRERSR